MFCDLWDDEPTQKWELLLGLERQLSLKPRTQASQSKVDTPGLVTFLKDLSSAGPRDGVGEGLSDGFLPAAGSSYSCLFLERPG